MTDEKEQQELLDMIERLLAGETVEAVGARDEELEKLMALAAELGEARPEPSAEFQQSLEARLGELGKSRQARKPGTGCPAG